MAWTGKIIGGVLGSFLGPWGAAIGVGIGHQFDKGANRVQATGMVVQVAFFGCLAKMAKADGTITQEEIQVVEALIKQMGYNPEMRKAAIDIFRKAKDDNNSAEDYLDQLADTIQYNPQIAMTFLMALHEVARSDGRIHANEKEILLQAERIFRLRAGTVEAMLGRRRSSSSSGSGQSSSSRREGASLENAYKVLEVSSSATDSEIKKAYREKCIEFHPDKLASKGLPDEFMKFANEQLARVNEAYEIIKESRR